MTFTHEVVGPLCVEIFDFGPGIDGLIVNPDGTVDVVGGGVVTDGRAVDPGDPGGEEETC